MSVNTAAPDSSSRTETRPIFIFESDGIRYGFEAHHVREVFFLPEVAPLPEAPRDIIGAIDLRGQIVPVMDLQRRFGYTPRDYTITDSAIVFECDGLLVALVVNAAIAVYDIPLSDFRDSPSYGRSADDASQPYVPKPHHFVDGLIQTADGPVLLLDCSELVHYSAALNIEETVEPEQVRQALLDPEAERIREFCPNATPEVREIFRQRAIALQMREQDASARDTLPLAIVEISGEFFGIDLKVVREFCEVKKIVPVPCCPAHILGNTNLRGEILTAISLHEVLDLPTYRRDSLSQAIVVEVDEVIFGIAIDAVFDVMHLDAASLAPTPSALQGQNDEFIRGTASYRGKMMGVLDIPAIVRGEVLVVDDR